MAKASFENPLSALFSGIGDLWKKKPTPVQLDPTNRIDGKRCLVTGASSGLGRAIAVELARRGGQVLMACRSGHPDAGEVVKAQSGSDSVEMRYLDLTDFRTVTGLCDELRSEERRFDIAVFNAGVVPSFSRRTEQGFEEMFAVNYLAKFLFVNRLLRDGTIPNSVFSEGRLAGTPSRGIPRIVFISSEAHRTPEPIDFATFGHFHKYDMGGSMKEYGFTKLLLTTFACELSRRLATENGVDVSVHALCPGAVNTNIAREAPGWTLPLLKIIFGLFFASPEKACEPAVYLSCSPLIEGRTGVYLHLMNEKEPASWATDSDMSKRLWDLSEQLLETGPLS